MTPSEYEVPGAIQGWAEASAEGSETAVCLDKDGKPESGELPLDVFRPPSIHSRFRLARLPRFRGLLNAVVVLAPLESRGRKSALVTWSDLATD